MDFIALYVHIGSGWLVDEGNILDNIGFALLCGLVLIDLDHFTPYPIFHWMGSVLFWLFFGIGLIYRKVRGG